MACRPLTSPLSLTKTASSAYSAAIAAASLLLTASSYLAYLVRANLLVGLAGSLLASQGHDLSEGLRLLRDELL
jgi:hypothetical protein